MLKKVLVCFVIMFFLMPGLFAQLKYLNLSPCEFRPVYYDQEYYASSNYFRHLGGSNHYYFAPVHLPHGAVIKNVMICYRDSSDSYLSVTMYRKSCINGSAGLSMFTWSSYGNIAGSRIKTIYSSGINYRTIYTGAYSYSVRVWFVDTSGLYIYGVRIAYE